ncbi:heavy metal-binding domain-containing protein [Pontibacter actiniarum]|uniref:heavy metal-binding domain-containing protein n=1 Tax=Pontibacter actiniarum TaxID=323450 RepID=UPI001B7FAC50
MHPEVQSTKPGKCPKCGMTLVKQKQKAPTKKQQAPPKKATKAKPATPSKKPVQQKQA